MILTAKLHVEGHSMEIEGISLLSCSYGFVQDVDQRGMPKSDVKGGTIKIQLYSIDDQEIMQWMITSDADKNGKVEFSRDDEDGKVFKTIKFMDARCISYQESFVRDGVMLTEILISARELTISDVTHTNTWSGY